ncbi:MAG: septal ring lytic transglycosylase RlpA family protein [Nitrospirae bacterium]|nr:septal ring lytic transglycosylase RlpA family protein [Nitrospirota bacterium]
MNKYFFNRLSRLIVTTILTILIIFIISCAPSRYERYPEASYTSASWYGPDFHGRPTASGERFDMYSRTCAHREHPFGTKLRVTNLSNGKSVDCIVNDRGPFVAGRDLDLSYASAKEIGLIGPGTGKVRIDVLGRESRYKGAVRVSDTVSVAAPKGPFVVQVGSFKEHQNAIRLKTALELKYRGVYVEETFLDGEKYFRVRLGKFNSSKDAYSLANTLAEEGYKVIIVK